MSGKKSPEGPVLSQIYLKFFDSLGNPVEARIEHDTDEAERQSASLLIEKYGAVTATPGTPAGTISASSTVPSMALSELIGQYIEEKALDKSWTVKTGEENAKIYDLLVEMLGDIPGRAIDIHRAKSVRDTLLKLPPGIRKSPLYRGLTISEILALSPTKTLNSLTVKKFMTRFSSLFDWAERMGYVDKNPFVKLSPVRTKAAHAERQRFDQADLKKLFETALFAVKPSKLFYRYWVPLLGLYTGARLNEICQLSVSDIRQEDSVWYLDINDEEEARRVKTIAARRQVPLHSKLIELGFLDYVDSLKRKSEARLFPELPLGKAGYGKKAGNWFNQQYRPSCGIPAGQRKSFHSFRHTFIDELIKAGVNDKAVSDMVGHEVSKSVTLTRYAKPYSPSELKPDVEKLVFLLNIPIHSWK